MLPDLINHISSLSFLSHTFFGGLNGAGRLEVTRQVCNSKGRGTPTPNRFSFKKETQNQKKTGKISYWNYGHVNQPLLHIWQHLTPPGHAWCPRAPVHMFDQPGNNKGHGGYKKRQQVTIRLAKWLRLLTKHTMKQLVIPMAEKSRREGFILGLRFHKEPL